MRMASRYGHAWVSQYGPLPDGIAAAEWRDTLAGVSREQMRDGFAEDSLRASDWPPTSTRFRAMCLDIPTIAEVRFDISKLVRATNHHANNSSELQISRFARLVWSYLDTYAFRHETDKRADRMLREAYELASAYVMDGGELPMEPVALIAAPEQKPHQPADPAVGRAHMDKIAEILRTDPVKPHTEVDDDRNAAS